MIPAFSDPESESQAAPGAPEQQRPLPFAPWTQPPQPRNLVAAAATSMGGIGRAFQLLPPPAHAGNHRFQSPGNADARNGGINVDNIFASIEVADESSSHANSNNMFHNFATNNVGIGSTLPFRKYSDCTNQRSRTIPASNGRAAAAASPPRANAGAIGMARSGSGIFSKSMGTSAAFLMRVNSNVGERCVWVSF
jgi:hypothetical protein